MQRFSCHRPGPEKPMRNLEYDPVARQRRAWNAERKLCTKRPLKPQQVWAIRFWLDGQRRLRGRALFDLAIDSKCAVAIWSSFASVTSLARTRATVVQQRTWRPV